ncbi:MAG TPA: TetR/AcrR family transcriptional regulator [Tenuifilaceae bacterium]|nr:TetR/AcrR family transcriptional regulator [Tenuifilaceae bacterium]HPE19162.1 TetR/AcrR family transcriptional regulator [Tenuifilaceae bacterium]HPJ45515.1 TetR/AcrR family transcriptional regulator [Tenuifilaceae bacterium]HPQ33831.1 TetR/AcrR family transcriptional regulator [Tenuifilaceae bacterium]HRX68200.1 TetR/AcrR family transcriptional regulator [Tenuifilaceae bacterium]
MKNTRVRILSESFKLFLSKGYREVTMKELVEKSKLSKGAFYHYFSSKEELFKESVKAFLLEGLNVKSFTPSYMVSLAENLKNFVDFKANMFSEMQETSNDNNLDTGYFTLVFQAIKLFPEIRNELISAAANEVETLEKIFITGIENGEVHGGLSPDWLAKLFSLMIDGAELNSVIGGEMDSIHEKEKELVDEFCKLIGT